ncbi:MAG: DegT/DnrJ/EryC1/StrS family aminotransferase [Myxococcales bacterium]|nr:MAG: DegT/DnrJ/EryC1/StrS family aminotransferase [Myxococcales bacterium]
MSEGRKVDFYRHDLGEAELTSLRQTLGTTFLTLGPRVGEFEARLGREIDVPHVVGVSSCTMGLHLTLHALGVGPGDEVITTPMTYISTPNAALYVGATPVFADVEPATGAIDPAEVARRITPRTRAIIGVHLHGQLCDMRALRAIADQHKLWLVEDAAHGCEGERDGVRPGQLGDAAVFSFYATKTITSGDGGAVATRHADLAARLRRLRNHGTSKDAASRHGGAYQHWDMVELGFKAAMTDIEAALLLPQLDRLEARRAGRQAVVERYEERLRGQPGVTLMERRGRSSHHLFTVLVERDRREGVLAALSGQGIGCAVNYRAVHTLSYYRERFAIPEEALPHAADIGARTVSLPLWPGLPLADVDHVCDRLLEALR